MTLGRFVLRNTLRNKRRTALTVLSVAFSLFLLIILAGIREFFTNPPSSDAADLRLICRRSTSFMEPLPIAYLPKIEKVPHVVRVMPIQFYMGQYKDPKNFFGSSAADPETFFETLTDLITTDEAKAAFKAEKTAAVAGYSLMKRFGWKVGDTITLTGTAVPADVELKIVGEFSFKNTGEDLFFRLDYLHDVLGDDGSASAFWIVADNADNMAQLAVDVDELFRNTPAETRTETERAFVLQFVSMMGNVKKFIGAIAVTIMFTMLLVTASTMGMTIRERMREVGILKSIGFPKRMVLGLIMGEAVLIAIFGGILASAATYSLRFISAINSAPGLAMMLNIPPATYAAAFAIGIAIALVSAFLPAFQASSITIVQAMRRVA